MYIRLSPRTLLLLSGVFVSKYLDTVCLVTVEVLGAIFCGELSSSLNSGPFVVSISLRREVPCRGNVVRKSRAPVVGGRPTASIRPQPVFAHSQYSPVVSWACHSGRFGPQDLDYEENPCWGGLRPRGCCRRGVLSLGRFVINAKGRLWWQIGLLLPQLVEFHVEYL